MNLKVLYIEDSEPDVELVKSLLAEHGFDCEMTVVEMESELKSALEGCPYDLILSDCSLPAYNGIAALSVARAKCPETPFVFVSGTLGEENAIECVKCGATDYVLKDRISRLPPVVRRALEEVEARRRHEQTLRELDASREAFYQAQKMETVGRLTAGIAHDFNNMLTVAIGFAEVILARTTEDDPIHGFAAEILGASRRSADLVQHLLSYSRNQSLSQRPVNINDEIRANLKMIEKLVGERVTVEADLAEDLWIVEIDPVRFAQIVMNLAANARDAMPEGGILRIETRNEHFQAPARASRIDLTTGDYVVMRADDNGTGMDEQTLDKIFEPFFTTKGLGKGTGLGLATSYGIVKQSGGTIVVQSTVGAGSSFEVYLPRSTTARDTRQQQIARRSGGAADVPHERILLVDDDVSILNLMKLVLGQAGYTVATASTAAEARILVAKLDGEIDILITDIVLPDASGIIFAGEVIRRWPGIPVLYTSGYAQSVVRETVPSAGEVTIIPKPIKVRDLMEAIRTALDRQQPPIEPGKHAPR